MVTFHTIVTHKRPHLDEVLAIWLVRKFGENLYPGISTARTVLWDAGPFTPDGRSPEEYEKEGYLLIGVGGGRLDEHATLNEHRKEGECAASLMARALGLTDDLRLKQLLRYVTANDTRGGAGAFEGSMKDRKDAAAFHLAALVNQLHRTHLDNVDAVIQWTSLFLDAHFQAQEEFHLGAKRVYEEHAQVQEVSVGEGQVVRIVSICSDLESLGQFSRSPMAKGGPADVFVQKRSNGQVQIFTNQRSQIRVNLDDVVQVLRLKEQRLKKNVVTTSFDALRAEGTVEGAEEWYYHKKAGSLLNGSLTAPNVPPTRLSLEFILEMIRVCVNPRAFQKDHKAHCLRNVCTHHESSCSWYDYGLQRCRSIRFQMKNATIPPSQLVRKAVAR